jgi:hypothetical protein
MKKIILLFIAVLAVSCSDTDPAPTPVSQSSPKLPSIVFYNNGGTPTKTFNLAYDSDRRLTQIVESTRSSEVDFVFTLTYDESDRLILIDQTGQYENQVTFTYGDDGRLSSWASGEPPRDPITYANGIYAVSIGLFTMYHACDDQGDITMINGGNERSFTYDATNKGAFRNVVGNYQLFGLFLDHSFPMFGTNKPLLNTAILDHFGNFTNTYDEEGYITNSTGLWDGGRQTWAKIIYGN